MIHSRSHFALALVCVGAWLSPLYAEAQVYGAACPTGIDINDCVANDLQPTGTLIVNGPSECNEGDVFSATVRILFSDGGGANERFTVGFFVGDNGESAVGGTSCTFDSFQPVVDPPNDNPLGGPYPELSGDSCGDIAKREPTYKDIDLTSIQCKDDDGDGNVDISYVLSWENNANQTSCTNPLDPTQFTPNPPKCRSDLEYDLPIRVEDPPSIDVAKGAFPAQLEEPGGLVRFAVTVINTSPTPTDPVEIVSFVDSVDGGPPQDVNGLLDCVVPFTLAPGQSKTCNFESPVNGVAGDVVTDTITVSGRDDEGLGVQDFDSAQVEIIAPDLPPPPGDLRLVKFASPSEVDEPGGTVQYDVLVANVSSTPVELQSLVDDLYGDLNGRGSCSLPQTLNATNPIYFCAFQERVSGRPGDTITDTIVATGTDGLPARNRLTAQDSASVIIADVGSNIEVIKTARPESVTEPGGTVEYKIAIQNTSPVDTVTINRIFDTLAFIQFGNGLPPGCSVPQTLVPNQTYECIYSLQIVGNSGNTVTNVVEASGRDDDNRLVFDLDAASVFIIGQQPLIDVAKTAVPPVVPVGGGTVTYVVAIQNSSTLADPVTITALTDSVDGGPATSLDGVGSCDLSNLVLQPAPDPNSFYLCSFTQVLGAGAANSQVTDIVTATGVDDEGTSATGSDDATVTYVSVPDNDVRELSVAKIASPVEIVEPGGPVTFTVFIANTSESTVTNPNLTLEGLEDSVYGELFTKGNCAPLENAILVPAASEADVVSCSFTETVNGSAGDVIPNVITATATYSNGLVTGTVIGQGDASVTIIDVPASLAVVKRATPVTVIEPGADVTFEIFVFNTSPDDQLRITSLVDNVHGDLLNNGLCQTPPPLNPGRDPYRCDFTAFVGGEPGFEERNTVIAAAEDNDGNTVEGNAQATVTVLNTPPSLLTTKTATPTRVPVPGGLVAFTFTTTNTSDADVVTLDTLEDNIFGDLNGQGDCRVPQTLPPGASYSCEFTTTLAGALGETHLDEVLATGTSDDGEPVASRANAIVLFVALVQSIPALGQVGLLSLTLLMGWLGWRKLKR